MGKLKVDLVIENCSELLTCKKDAKDLIGLEKDMFIGIKDEKIIFIGSKDKYEKQIDNSNAITIDGSGKVVLPGFVDCHTHLVFGESRIDEYVAKLTTTDVNEIKKKVPVIGLDSSIQSTRNASFDELLEESIVKVNKMLEGGTTTMEIKSGYGIDKDTEIKQLEVIKELKNKVPVTLFATYLGAHFWDKTMGKEKYIQFMIEEVMPIVQEKDLAQYCDVWCDDGFYTAEESKTILEAARKYGMKSKIHTDCYSDIGGSDLAAEIGMSSADHLNFTTESSMKKMAEKGVVGVVIPGTDFSVSHPKPFNPRPMLDAGMNLAIATNLNPGNWMESMQLSIAMGCKNHAMTPEESIRATTYGGACALDSEDKYGTLEVGKYADIQIWDTNDYRDVAYKLGVNLVEKVIKHGKIVVER